VEKVRSLNQLNEELEEERKKLRSRQSGTGKLCLFSFT